MKKAHNETVVGFFVIIGFLFLSLIVFFVSGVYLFRPGYSVNVLYDYVSILDKGAPVRMAGVRIGEVSQVDLYYEKQSQNTRVKVKLFIEKGVEIRENYKFMIRGTHVLSEPHIEISPEQGDGALIKNNQVIEGDDPVPVEDLIQKAHHITENLDDILSGVKGAMGQDGATFKELTINLSKLSKSLEAIVGGSEKDIQKMLSNLRESTDSFKKVMDQMEEGHGTVGKLLVEDELYQEMKGFVAEIKAHPWRLLKKDKKFFLF